MNTRAVSFREAFRFWLKLGFISFGGPTGQIAIMHKELVDRRGWISESRFLHALNYCMFLPGPEATQLAIYVGWLLHRTIGGIVAGVLFVLPSVFVLWLLSYIYVTFGNVPLIASIFYGLKGAVIAIVASAVLRIGQRALKNAAMWLLAAAAFTSIFFFRIPFPLIIAGAGLIGLLGGKLWPQVFSVLNEERDGSAKEAENILQTEHTKPSWMRALRVISVCVILWWLPVLIAGWWQGREGTLYREGIFFSKAAMVTFGGAYAVLPYVSQQAVERYHWLRASQMIDGLGLAETTPGPLIMVVQFVGFLGAWNHPGQLSPLLSATLGAFLTTWVTFVPCFLWIFLGAPHVEQLRGNQGLNSTLSGITAAVVGVVLNLAVWFALHALLPSRWRIDWFLLAVSAIAFVGIVRWKWGIVPVIAGAALLGWIYLAICSAGILPAPVQHLGMH